MSLPDSPKYSSMATLASPSSGNVAFSIAVDALANTPSVAVSSVPSFITTFANNKHLVGPAWILSSAILTTYSTTKFLKYKNEEEEEWMTTSTSKNGVLNLLKSLKSRKQSTEKTTIHPQKVSRASLLTLYRFSGSLCLGLLMHSQFYNLAMLYPRLLKTISSSKSFFLPSLFLFIANYSNSIALDRIGISLTYTSKCGIPLLTVLFTLLLDGINALPSRLTLCSLIPIALGIGAASWNSPTFELFGFLAALTSTTSQAALNVVSKRVMRSTGVKGAEAQRAMVFVALGFGLLMASVNGFGGVLKEWKENGIRGRNGLLEKEGVDGTDLEQAMALAPPSSHPPLWLTFLAILAYHMEYVLSFMFVGLVEPITYGTCDALRRLLIIVSGRQLFGGDKFSSINLGGIAMALLGALMYSITSARGVGGIPKSV